MLEVANKKGFSLLELMIVVAIISIIAFTIYPSYVENVRDARRADAAEALMRVAQAQERHFTQFGRYATNLGGAVGDANLGLTLAELSSEGGDAVVGISADASATAFVLTATITPVDPDCGNLTLNQLGQRGNSEDADGCW